MCDVTDVIEARIGVQHVHRLQVTAEESWGHRLVVFNECREVAAEMNVRVQALLEPVLIIRCVVRRLRHPRLVYAAIRGDDRSQGGRNAKHEHHQDRPVPAQPLEQVSNRRGFVGNTQFFARSGLARKSRQDARAAQCGNAVNGNAGLGPS
jgi:hypothetical protein